MKENKKVIYLDQEGYKRYFDELDSLKGELKKVLINKNESYNATSSKTAYDNFDFEENQRQEAMILQRIYDKLDNIKNIEVIEEKDKKENHVNLNDLVKVTLIEDGTEEEEIIKLVSYKTVEDNNNEEAMVVSLSSPIGSAIYGKKEGDVVSYSVGNQTYQVVIKELLKEKKKAKER